MVMSKQTKDSRKQGHQSSDDWAATADTLPGILLGGELFRPNRTGSAGITVHAPDKVQRRHAAQVGRLSIRIGRMSAQLRMLGVAAAADQLHEQSEILARSYLQQLGVRLG